MLLAMIDRLTFEQRVQLSCCGYARKSLLFKLSRTIHGGSPGRESKSAAQIATSEAGQSSHRLLEGKQNGAWMNKSRQRSSNLRDQVEVVNRVAKSLEEHTQSLPLARFYILDYRRRRSTSRTISEQPMSYCSFRCS